MSKVSVIIPTYNRFTFLKNAIQSVKDQTHTNTEIIIINDGSTDPDYTTVASFLPPSAIYITLNQNSSTVVGKYGRAAYTRNIGMKLASGDYIAFLDDDDVWLPNKLKKQLDIMKKKGCEMSCSEAYIGNGPYDSQKTYPRYIQDYHKKFYIAKNITRFPPLWDLAFLQRHNSCITSSVIISKNIMYKVGLMNYIRVGEDYNYWLRVLQHTKCAFIKSPLVYYDNGHGDGSLY